MDEVIDRLADYCHSVSVTVDDLPDHIVHAATQRLIDTLGCAVGAIDCDGARIGRAIGPRVDANATEHPARSIGARDRSTDVEAAGFVNSAMIRYLDFNDTVPRAGHPSDALGPLIAHADAYRQGGSQLVTALVVAFDVFIRIASVTRLRERGWDQGYGIGLAVAAGASKLLGLDRAMTRHALAISAVSNVPLRNTRSGQLSTWKGLATAYSARNAYFGTLLAAGGATGPEAPIGGRHGLKELVTGDFGFEPLEGQARFLTERARLKYWPVESHLQPVVWAAIELGRVVTAAEIESVEVATNQTAWHETASERDKWDPRTRETADHSLPYVFVRSLQAGGLDLAAFDPESYLDPAVRPLMDKISAHVDDEIEARFTEDVVLRVVSTTTSGEKQSIEVVNPRGHDKNPLTDAEIDDKFLRLTEPVIGSSRAHESLAWWRGVAEHDDISAGLDLLAVQP